VARKPRPSPFTVRLSPEQRAELESRADRAGLSIGGYFTSAVFDTPPPRQSRRPSVVEQELAKLMGAIGRIGSNVNQLTHQAHLGSWPDSRLLKQACDDIRMMRDTLIRAFGMTPPDDPPTTPGP
jgi:hypothetical protein